MTSNRPTHTTSHSFAGLPSATFRDFDEDDLATPTQSTWHRRSRTTVEIPIDVPLTNQPNSQLPKHILMSYIQWIEDLSARLQADLRTEEADIADLKAYKNMMDLEVEGGDSLQWRTLLMRMLPGAKDLDEAMRTYNEILDKKYEVVAKTSARMAHCRMRAYEARGQFENAVITARERKLVNAMLHEAILEGSKRSTPRTLDRPTGVYQSMDVRANNALLEKKDIADHITGGFTDVDVHASAPRGGELARLRTAKLTCMYTDWCCIHGLSEQQGALYELSFSYVIWPPSRMTISSGCIKPTPASLHALTSQFTLRTRVRPRDTTTQQDQDVKIT